MNEHQKMLVERFSLETNSNVEPDWHALCDAYVTIMNQANIILEVNSVSCDTSSAQYYIVVYIAREDTFSVIDDINTTRLTDEYDRVALHLFDSLKECWHKHDAIRDQVLSDYSV